MATFKGTDWFGSGPTRVVPVSTEAEIRATRFPGLEGEYHLNMGRAGGRIRQQGTLIAASAGMLLSLVNNLRSQVGQRGTLVDDFGFSYTNCTLVRVTFDGSRRVDPQGNHYLDYTVEYRQTLSSIV
jgi:hypothetical protein